MSLLISLIKTLLKLNTCVQRIQGVVAVPGLSSLSVKSFCAVISYDNFHLGYLLMSIFILLFLIRGLVAPEHRTFWLSRHLRAARMRMCTVYTVLSMGSAAFPEIPS